MLIPVTTPLAEPTVALAVLLQLQVPPLTAWLSVVIVPTHRLGLPLIVAGVVFTVTVVIAVHPELTLYVILAVPAPTPVTIPVVRPTVAFAVLLLLQVPPVVVLASVVVCPTHTLGLPVLPASPAFTVTIAVRVQLLPTVYVMMEVPVAMGVTTPVEEPIVATEVVPELQVPPVVVDVRVLVFPIHNDRDPVIAPGRLATVSASMLLQPLLRV